MRTEARKRGNEGEKGTNRAVTERETESASCFFAVIHFSSLWKLRCTQLGAALFSLGRFYPCSALFFLPRVLRQSITPGPSDRLCHLCSHPCIFTLIFSAFLSRSFPVASSGARGLRNCSQSDERQFILHPLWYLSPPCRMAEHVITSAPGKPQESGQTPVANTTASVCMCVCMRVPVVIITRIRAEPNPRRVPRSPSPSTSQAQPSLQHWSPSLSSHGKQSSRPDISTTPGCQTDKFPQFLIPLCPIDHP